MMDAVFDQVSTRVDQLLSNRRLVVLMVVVLFGAGLYRQLTSFINHDTAWYLYATGKFLDGAQLYVDIVEVNPPLAFYLTVPGVLLSRATGLFVVDAFVIYVFALIAILLLLAALLLRRETTLSSSLRNAVWLAAAGVPQVTGRAAPRFDSYLLALEAALDGQGVAIAPHFLVTGDLKSGRLVKPFKLEVPQPRHWYLVCRKERRAEPRIGRFRDWLIDQVRRDPAIA